jgi:hypothetical protein
VVEIVPTLAVSEDGSSQTIGWTNVSERKKYKNLINQKLTHNFNFQTHLSYGWEPKVCAKLLMAQVPFKVKVYLIVFSKTASYQVSPQRYFNPRIGMMKANSDFITM